MQHSSHVKMMVKRRYLKEYIMYDMSGAFIGKASDAEYDDFSIVLYHNEVRGLSFDLNDDINELCIVRKLNHPNVLKYLDILEVDIDRLGFLCEAHHSLLSSIIEEDIGLLYETCIVKNIMKQLFTALDYLHSKSVIHRHGAPRVIITDHGAVFRSRLVSSLVDLCNIDHRFITAYHPQTNGLTEHFNKTLANMLSMYVDAEQKNWDEILPFVTFAYNTAKQETTGFTPFYLLHGREVETTLDTMLPFCPNEFDDNNITKIAARAEESRQLARVHTLRAQDRDHRRYVSKHQMVSYAPGDLVWVYTPVRKVGLSEKLLRRYFGPYQVLRRLSAGTYEVQDFDPASRKRKLKEVVHVLRMKPYHDPAEQIETEDKEIQDIIPPKEPYKGPITCSRIKTLEQNDSGALSSF
ncbi:transposon Ty3-I Gag-Pol polyprotein [Trichonephila inaurata madagascariensis]|uniref:Transposon Ty3-I Gag-Pol polyprotein n=1 Tax=Trichonephila inaurata madagascariensis TaxID=2747483 RepID=A0A8X6YQW3_9ARAC|nr:transposon Ty3-I Gag-Pol polyprotein [Trichonephila inaurata madagascariensis]